MSNMRMPKGYRLVANDCYAINESGDLFRVAPSKGTRPGKHIHPYGNNDSVRVYPDGDSSYEVTTIWELVDEAFH